MYSVLMSHLHCNDGAGLGSARGNVGEVTDQDTHNNLETEAPSVWIALPNSYLTSRTAKVTLLPASSLPSSPPSPSPETSVGSSGSAGLWLAGNSSLSRDLRLLGHSHV